MPSMPRWVKYLGATIGIVAEIVTIWTAITDQPVLGVLIGLGFVQQLFEQLGHLVMCGRIV